MLNKKYYCHFLFQQGNNPATASIIKPTPENAKGKVPEKPSASNKPIRPKTVSVTAQKPGEASVPPRKGTGSSRQGDLPVSVTEPSLPKGLVFAETVQEREPDVTDEVEVTSGVPVTHGEQIISSLK